MPTSTSHEMILLSVMGAPVPYLLLLLDHDGEDFWPLSQQVLSSLSPYPLTASSEQ